MNQPVLRWRGSACVFFVLLVETAAVDLRSGWRMTRRCFIAGICKVGKEANETSRSDNKKSLRVNCDT